MQGYIELPAIQSQSNNVFSFSRGECTETCKARRREVENELKQIRRELKLREDQTKQLERETQACGSCELHTY